MLDLDVEPPKFTNGTSINHSTSVPLAPIFIVSLWLVLIVAYVISKWRQKPKSMYIIPRVFVLCSPRTIQFQYEIILRVGLASTDFNPDRHDIDITVLGQTNNEIVPMTRLNTKTLFDEPLITNLSIIVYRLVEMPPLGSLILSHSGPYRAWVYVYDFTVIDLTTNREQYFSLNKYIGSMNRSMPLRETNQVQPVTYPIDDVPIPNLTIEDTFLYIFALTNCMMFIIDWMPFGCSYKIDIIVILATTLGGCSLSIFQTWILKYNLRWNQERKEFFNEYQSLKYCPSETYQRIIIVINSFVIGGVAIYFSFEILDWKEALIWILISVNCFIIVFGLWFMMRQFDIGPILVEYGLSFRGLESQDIGLKHSELIQRSKSGSNSDDDRSSISLQDNFNRGIGPRSSVKSFGFNPTSRDQTRFSQMSSIGSRASTTGATPSHQGIRASISHSKQTSKAGAKLQEQVAKESSRSRSHSHSRNQNQNQNQQNKLQAQKSKQ